MSLVTVKQGLYTTLNAIPALTGLVYKYIPLTIHTEKLLYIRLMDVVRVNASHTVVTYRLLARLLVVYQDNEGAETILDGLINSIPAAVNANPTLGGTASIATIANINSDPPIIDINGTACRYADFEVEIKEKGAFTSGI